MTDSRYACKYYIMLIFALTVMFAGNICLYAGKIKTIDFPGFSEIFSGDSAVIRWRFDNVDIVKIEGFDTAFSNFDSVKVAPEFTRSYSVTAYQYKTSIFGSDDSLIAGWRVYVKPKGEDVQIKTGLKPTKAGETEQSNYFTELDDSGEAKYPTKIKILRTLFEDETRTQCTVRALLMDDAGRYIPGLSQFSDNIYLSAVQYCTNGKLESGGSDMTEIDYKTSKQSHLSLVVEHSAASIDIMSVWNSIDDFLKKPENEDIISISYFNHVLSDFISFTSAEKASEALESNEFELPKGLNAIYKAVFKTLVNLKESKDKSLTQIVVFAFWPDNGDVFMDLDDVVSLAVEMQIPVYAVAVGENAETFPLKYLCSATGGRFYSVNESNVGDISKILGEISFAGKAGYDFKIRTGSLSLEFCEKLKSEISVRTVAGIYSDEWRVVLRPEKYLSAYQAIAAFDAGETNIKDSYKQSIEELTTILLENPTTPIYLTGHASPDESDNSMELSLRRAQAVRRLLVENGVPSSKIRIRGEGAAKPRYYFQSEPWQQYFNRRVEIRWLDPDLLPYEILAAQTWTEEDAMKMVEEWEDRGCRSYFERYIVGENPAYRVKLWGYRSIEEAKDAAKTLERKFRQKLMVD